MHIYTSRILTGGGGGGAQKSYLGKRCGQVITGRGAGSYHHH